MIRIIACIFLFCVPKAAFAESLDYNYANYVGGGAGCVWGIPTVAASCGLRVGQDSHLCDFGLQYQEGILVHSLHSRCSYQYRFPDCYALRPYCGIGGGLSYCNFYLPLGFIQVEIDRIAVNAEFQLGCDWYCAEHWSLFAEASLDWPLASYDGEEISTRTEDPTGSASIGIRYYW